MKKILANFLVLILISSCICVYAQESANLETTQFTNGVEYRYNLAGISYKPYSVGANASSEITGGGSFAYNKSGLIVLKLPFPKIAANQDIGKYVLCLTERIENALFATDRRALLALDGFDWQTKLSSGTYGYTSDERLNLYYQGAQSTATVATAWTPYRIDGGTLVQSVGEAYSSYPTPGCFKLDITEYAREKYDEWKRAKETNSDLIPAFYAVLASKDTVNVFWSASAWTTNANRPGVEVTPCEYEGLIKVKEMIPFKDTAAVNNTGFTCPMANQTSIHKRADAGSYALFKAPLPNLLSSQTIVDYKIYFGIRSNLSTTGYNKFDIWKVTDGASYFENQWTNTTNPITDYAKLDGSTNYLNIGTMNYLWSSNGYDAYEYTSLDLTEYAKELLSQASPKSEMYIAFRDNTSSTVTVYGDGSSYQPYVEYTILDTNGVNAGKVNIGELKIVPSKTLITSNSGKNTVSSPNKFADATHVASLTADTAYRVALVASNYSASSQQANMYAAIYADDTLESIVHLPCTITSFDSDFVTWSGEFSAPAGSTVKAFLWDYNDNSPLIGFEEVSVVAATTE